MQTVRDVAVENFYFRSDPDKLRTRIRWYSDDENNDNNVLNSNQSVQCFIQDLQEPGSYNTSEIFSHATGIDCTFYENIVSYFRGHTCKGVLILRENGVEIGSWGFEFMCNQGSTNYIHKDFYMITGGEPTEPVEPEQPETPTPGAGRSIVLKMKIYPIPFVTLGMDPALIIANRFTWLVNEIGKVLGSNYQVTSITYNSTTRELQINIQELGSPLVPILAIVAIIAIIGFIVYEIQELINGQSAYQQTKDKSTSYNDTYNACKAAGGTDEECAAQAQETVKAIYGETESGNGGILQQITNATPLILGIIILSAMSGLNKK